VLPPRIAALFTVSELAALRIVSDEVRAKKTCQLTVGEIAARAGCSETSARGALRAAAAAGLLMVTERRRRGAPNWPNLVRIVSQEWLTWLSKRPRPAGMATPPGGSKKPEATDKHIVLNSATRRQAHLVAGNPITAVHEVRGADPAAGRPAEPLKRRLQFQG